MACRIISAVGVLVDPLRLIHPTQFPDRRVDQGAQRRIHLNSASQIPTSAAPFSVDPLRLIHPTHLPNRRVDQGAQRRIHQNHRDRTI